MVRLPGLETRLLLARLGRVLLLVLVAAIWAKGLAWRWGEHNCESLLSNIVQAGEVLAIALFLATLRRGEVTRLSAACAATASALALGRTLVFSVTVWDIMGPDKAWIVRDRAGNAMVLAGVLTLPFVAAAFAWRVWKSRGPLGGASRDRKAASLFGLSGLMLLSSLAFPWVSSPLTEAASSPLLRWVDGGRACVRFLSTSHGSVHGGGQGLAAVILLLVCAASAGWIAQARRARVPAWLLGTAGTHALALVLGAWDSARTPAVQYLNGDVGGALAVVSLGLGLIAIGLEVGSGPGGGLSPERRPGLSSH